MVVGDSKVKGYVKQLFELSYHTVYLPTVYTLASVTLIIVAGW